MTDLLKALADSLERARDDRASRPSQTRTSRCAHCAQPISITLAPGQRWDDVEWLHDEPATHQPAPELRVAVDATCPGCDYPEIGYAPAREEFVCSRCGHTTNDRPEA